MTPTLHLEAMAAAYFGEGFQRLPHDVLDALQARGETLVVAESCTGGGIGAALTAVPGSSAVFLGGVIAYSNALKMNLLAVTADTLEAHGAVSEPVVSAMAEGARKRLSADWAVAVSGVAGPGGGSIHKPVGTVHFAVAGPQKTHLKQYHFPADAHRIAIQHLSVFAGLHLLSSCFQD